MSPERLVRVTVEGVLGGGESSESSSARFYFDKVVRSRFWRLAATRPMPTNLRLGED
jgi:hypothetical protein